MRSTASAAIAVASMLAKIVRSPRARILVSLLPGVRSPRPAAVRRRTRPRSARRSVERRPQRLLERRRRLEDRRRLVAAVGHAVVAARVLAAAVCVPVGRLDQLLVRRD